MSFGVTTASPWRAVKVELASFGGVAQHGVRLGDELELLGRLRLRRPPGEYNGMDASARKIRSS